MITTVEGQTVWTLVEPTLEEITGGDYTLPVNFKVVDINTSTYRLVSFVPDSENGARRVELGSGNVNLQFTFSDDGTLGNGFNLPLEEVTNLSFSGTDFEYEIDEDEKVLLIKLNETTKNQENIPRLITLTLDDLGMTSSNTEAEINQALADYINGLELTIGEKDLYFFQVVTDTIKKTYLIKDQGKGLVENLTPDKLFSIEGGAASGNPGGESSNPYIEVTKAELDTHISNSTLEPGTLYKITGVQPFLYGGTDIYLRAISTNTLEEKGMGKFYVPKYDKNVDRYGIFNGYVNVTVTDSSYPAGTISYGANVTTNNGATGKFRSVNLIEYVSGDWSTVTEMYINGITFNVTSAIISTYNINDKVIFGGKVWKNLTGNHGNIVDIFTLSNDWEVIPYNETDYNIEFDEIGYDIENDCINYRRDKSNNIVEFSYNWWFYLENNWMNGDMENSFSNPIKCFQWGNHFDYNFYMGNLSNSIRNSLFECINSTLSYIYSNTLNNGYIYSNTLNNGQIHSNTLNNGQIYSNTLNNGYIYSNTLNNGQIYSNTLENFGQIYSNTLNNGYIYSNTLNNGQIHSNTLENNGQIYSNTLENFGQIYSNTLNNGYIYSNTLNNGQIYSNTLENFGQIYSNTLNNGYIYSNTLNNGQIHSNTLENNGYIYSNTLENNGQIRLGLSSPINNKSIRYLTINRSDIGGDSGINLSNATLVYADYERIVFKNSAGETKIRYIDGNGNTVIANLTD